MSYKEFYEIEAERFNIWDCDKFSKMAIKEFLRYETLLSFVPQGKKTLDLGCGSGYMSYLMAKKGNQVTALDISEQRLSKFRKLAIEHTIEQKVGDFLELDLPPYDIIVCQEVLEHLPDYKSCLTKCSRILNPDGHAIFCVPFNEDIESKLVICPHCLKKIHPNGHLHSFNHESFERDLVEAGFRIEQLITICNDKTIKWHRKLKLVISKKSIYIDKIYCILYSRKVSYLVAITRK